MPAANDIGRQNPESRSGRSVWTELRVSAKRLAGVAIFSGVVNLLMLAGPLYMLQVYDRVIPSHSI
jgi:ABC-type protease/lipase transport system fused ATPase/permease subunit